MTEEKDDIEGNAGVTKTGTGAAGEETAQKETAGDGETDLSRYNSGNDKVKAVWAVGIVAVLFVLWNMLFASPATRLSTIKIQIAGIEKELAALHSAELTYKGAHGAFTTDLSALEYKKKRDAITVTITGATGECYSAEARHKELRGAFIIDCTGKLSERFDEGDR